MQQNVMSGAVIQKVLLILRASYELPIAVLAVLVFITLFTCFVGGLSCHRVVVEVRGQLGRVFSFLSPFGS